MKKRASGAVLCAALMLALTGVAEDSGQAAQEKTKHSSIVVTIVGTDVRFEAETATYSVANLPNASSGLPTGKRQHKPIVLTKRIDKSTSALLELMKNRVALRQVEIEVSAGGAGRTSLVTYRLVGARVVSSKLVHLERGGEIEEIELYFDKIEILFEDGGVTHVDDWETPVV